MHENRESVHDRDTKKFRTSRSCHWNPTNVQKNFRTSRRCGVKVVCMLLELVRAAGIWTNYGLYTAGTDAPGSRRAYVCIDDQ